jgi:hypothetical protein
MSIVSKENAIVKRHLLKREQQLRRLEIAKKMRAKLCHSKMR